MTIITYFNSKSGQSSLRISEKDSKTSKIRLRRTKSAFDSPETCKFDDKLIRSVVGTLSSAALVNRNSKGDSQDLHLHTLVRYWASTRLAKSSRHAAWFRAASLVCITSENPGKHIWSDYEVELRTHAQALLSYPADFMYQQGSPDAVSRLIYRLLTLVTTNINVPESKHAGLIECTLDRLGQKRGRPSLEYFPLYNLLADKYMEQGRYEDAVQTLKGTLTTVERGLDTRQQDNFGDLIRTQIQLGEAYRTLGSYDQASALLEAALKRQSRRASQNDADIRKIQQLLAVTYMQAGQSSRAIALLLLVVDELSSTEGRGSSDLLEARFTLGKAFLGAGRHQEAVDILRSLVSSYPSFSSSNSVAPDPRYHLARALLLGNQADAALELLSQVRINRDQRNDRQTALSRLVDGEMARCHLHLGDGIQAYKLFNQVFEQSGTNSGIAGVGLPRFEDELLDDFLVANVKNDVPAKTLDLAVKHLERRLATATHARTDVLQRITATKLRLAIVYRLDRQYRSAIRLLEGILETLTTAEKPDTKQMSLCRYNLSKCLVAQEHPTSAKQAISHLRAFIQVLDTNQVNPYTGQHVDALFELSRAYHIAKDFRQAVNMLEEAMDLAQGDDHILKNDRVRLFKDIVSGLLARKSHGRAADLLARAVARQQGSGTAQDEIAQDVVADYQKRIKQSIADLKTQFMEQVTIHEASQASNSDSEEDISD
ncbi:Hypothetical protein D9617_4g001550 [Elsinoe fawcettii]|nr:Hypothetical protein D9617_4g001550 [Elsinoe fawcettii]